MFANYIKTDYNICGGSMDQLKIGKFISSLRKDIGVTQQVLAEHLGVTDKAVSKWERGISCPDISLLGPISDYFHITINELLLGEKKEHSISKEEIEKINEDILAYSYNQMGINKQYQKKLKIIISIISILLLLILLFFGIYSYTRIQKQKELSEYTNRLEKNLQLYHFEKDKPLRSPNWILNLEGVTYVVPTITYKNSIKTEIYKEILSYSDYENYNGIIVYFNGKNISVYHYENIGAKKTNVIMISCNQDGELKKDKKYSKKEKEFYSSKKEEIKTRVIQIETMWHSIYEA